MSASAGSANSARYVDFDEYVDLKLQKTRATIKTTDLLVALAGVAAMFLGYLLTFVVLDQWVVPGGFGIGLRWTLLLTLLVATVAWLVWKVGRPYIRSVNRLFAAHEIEKSEPGLKSNLLNLVDLRASGREIDPTVLRALERHAAVQLQQIDVTQAIDHRPLMRTAYVLLAVVVMFCLYALISPKKISNSIWRGLLPGVNLEVSTRTEILNVQPGDTTVQARTSVEVFADLAGVIPEKVVLLYTTADGKFQNEPVELRPDAEGQTRFKGLLVGENGQGLLQDLTYVVSAGDAVSPQFHITVEQPPSATPDKVKFEFPAYMKLESTEQPGGQIDAWEGAKVTLSAHTNMPVKSAVVEFLDDAQAAKSNGEDVPMTVSSDGRHLEAKWPLALRSDATYSKHYRIQCKTAAGATDPQPTIYGITIRPDLPPEVALLEPVRDLEAPANAIIPLLIQARDPDFELSRINLHVEKAGQSILNDSISDTKQSRALLKHDLALDPLGLSAGDVIEFWVEAFDNKQPRANRKNTPRLKVTIIKPVSQKEAQQQLTEDQKQRDQRLADAQQEQNQDGRPDQQPQEAGANDPPRDPNDPSKPDRDPMPRENGEPSKDEAAGKNGNKGQPGQPKDKGKEQNQSGDGADQRDSGTTDNKSGESSKDNPKQGAPKQDGSNNKEGSNKDGKSEKEQKPLSADGSEDDKVLEKLIQKLGQPRDGKPGEEKTPPDGSNADSKDKPQPKAESGTKDPKQENSRPDNTGTDPKTNGANNDPATKDNPKPGPMPAETDPKNEPGKTDGSKPKDATKPNGDSNPSNDPKNDANNKGPRPETPPNGDPKPNEPDGPKNDKGPQGAEAPKNDATNKSQNPADKGDMPKNATSPEKGTNDGKPGPGEKPDPASPKKNGADNKQPAEPKPNGPQEQAPDSPDAIKKPGTGDEKGPAKPETDPDAKTTPKQGEGLNRDPKDKASTRPTDPKNDGSTPPPKNDPKADPKAEKQPGKQPNDPKIDQQPTEPGKTPMSQKTQKKDGDPNAADEPLKGPGNKDQKSDKPTAGGEPGGSKQDKNGKPGSNQSGEGDPNNRPGTQQKSDSKDGKPGAAKDPGAGSKGDEKGPPKPGGSKEGDPSGDQPEGTDKPDGTDKPADKGPSQDGGKGGDSQKGDQPASDKQSDKKQGGNQKQGDNKQQDKDQGDQKGGDEQGDSKGQDGGKGGEGKGESDKDSKSPSNGKPSDKPKKGAGGKQGKMSGGGGDQNAPATDNPSGDADGSATNLEESEAANLEYNKQATELVLKRLQDGLERGDVDPELLEQLGWTEAEMKRFAERLGKHLQESKSLEETPESLARRQQFEEMLKSLDLKKQGTKRSGENSPQRDVNTIESKRANVPPQYKKAYEQFTKDLARQKQPGSTPSPK